MAATEVLERGDEAPQVKPPLDEAWHGLRDTLPFMFGSIPFGLLFGTLATGKGLSLVDHVRHLTQAWRFPLAAFLTDETFAVMERRYRTQSAKADLRPRGGGANAHWYYLASCFGMYVNWQTWTFLGITVGQNY